MLYPHTRLPRTRTVTTTVRRQGGRNPVDSTIRARLGHPGRCPDGDGLAAHVLLFDNSASVVGVDGNDCVGRRFEETRIALDLLGHSCHCGRELVGVVHFDSGLGDVAPTPVGTRAGRQAVEDALRIPPGSVGTSTIGPALATAKGFADAGPLTTLVILSDFVLTDRDEVTQLVEAPAPWAEHVHLIFLATAPIETDHEARPWVTVTSLGRPGPGRTPGDVALAMHRSFTRTRRSTRRIP